MVADEACGAVRTGESGHGVVSEWREVPVAHGGAGQAKVDEVEALREEQRERVVRGVVGAGDRTQVPVPALALFGLGGSTAAARENLASDEALERPSGEHGTAGSRRPDDGASPQELTSTHQRPFRMSVLLKAGSKLLDPRP